MVVAGRASGCGMVVAPFASHVPPASFAPVSGEGRCAPHYPPSCSISEGVLAPPHTRSAAHPSMKCILRRVGRNAAPQVPRPGDYTVSGARAAQDSYDNVVTSAV